MEDKQTGSEIGQFPKVGRGERRTGAKSWRALTEKTRILWLLEYRGGVLCGRGCSGDPSSCILDCIVWKTREERVAIIKLERSRAAGCCVRRVDAVDVFFRW